jgi:hypothetical protein
LPSCATGAVRGDCLGQGKAAEGRASHLLEREEVGSVLRVIEGERCGLVQRHGAGVGLAVRAVALVNLQSFELVLVLSHRTCVGRRAVCVQRCVSKRAADYVRDYRYST